MDKPVEQELTADLIRHFRQLARYWAELPEVDKATGRRLTMQDRCEGVVHSMLAALDGCSMVLPAFTLVAHVHPEDEDQTLEGVTIDTALHELLYSKAIR